MGFHARPTAWATLTAAVGATAVLAGCAAGAAVPPAAAPAAPRPSTTSTPAPTGPPPVSCTGGQVVDSADGLRAALARAGPGTTIRLADGRYDGTFAATAAGTAAQPITLCGGQGAVLDGGAPDAAITLHLTGADHWRLAGFSVQGGQKGVMVDTSQGVLIEGLSVSNIGDEAIHLRNNSSDNTVRNNVIHDTGLHTKKFGEGIYVGTAKSNWCEITACEPDHSDRNVIENNTISATTAENVDIKEGTTGGTLRGNTFDGTGTTAADSWVDVKGNDWQITANTGTHAPTDGFQTHVILDGWGEGNRFARNTSTVDSTGYGINVTKRNVGTVVLCDNTATGAAAGMSSIPCTNG